MNSEEIAPKCKHCDEPVVKHAGGVFHVATDSVYCECEAAIAESEDEGEHFIGTEELKAHFRRAASQPSVREVAPPTSAVKLLADVMHLWVDGYIAKSPSSAAPVSISETKFEEIEKFLSSQGISVDYHGWQKEVSNVGPK